MHRLSIVTSYHIIMTPAEYQKPTAPATPVKPVKETVYTYGCARRLLF